MRLRARLREPWSFGVRNLRRSTEDRATSPAKEEEGVQSSRPMLNIAQRIRTLFVPLGYPGGFYFGSPILGDEIFPFRTCKTLSFIGNVSEPSIQFTSSWGLKCLRSTHFNAKGIQSPSAAIRAKRGVFTPVAKRKGLCVAVSGWFLGWEWFW